MKTKLIILLITIAFVATADAQEDYTLSDMNLFGKVKSIIETRVTVDSSIICIYGSDTEREDTINYYFNEAGNLIEQEKSFVYWHAKRLINYKYNTQGKLIKKLIVPLDSAIASSTDNRYRVVYYYNDKGLIETTVFFKNDNQVGDTASIYKYNDFGDYIEIAYCSLSSYFRNDNKSLIKEKYIRQYDTKGHLIEYECYNEIGVKEYSMKYNYDTKSRIIKIEEEGFTQENDSKSYETYKYDDFGNIIEKTLTYTRYGVLKGLTWGYNSKYGYVYDTNNNWTTKTGRDKGYISTTKRIIEYYE